MTFDVTLEPGDDGWGVAECPALPGCVSQGKDGQEAIENIRGAITAWLYAEDRKHQDVMTNQGKAAVLVSL